MSGGSVMSSSRAPSSSSIEWHDSPVFVHDRISKLKSQAPQIRTAVDERKFDEEFDRWFSNGSTDVNSTNSSEQDSGGTTRKIDVTPPVLKTHNCGFRKVSPELSASKTPAEVLKLDESVMDDTAEIIRSLKEAKANFERILEEKRQRHRTSSVATCSISYDDIPSNDHLDSSGSADIISKSTQIDLTPTARDGVRTLISARFRNPTSEEPSPITRIESRKRRRKTSQTGVFRDGRRLSFCSSDDDNDDGSSPIGPKESTPLSARKTVHCFDEKKDALDGYDSMDDDAIDELLSQIPYEPQPDVRVHTVIVKAPTPKPEISIDHRKQQQSLTVIIHKNSQCSNVSSNESARTNVVKKSNCDRTPFRRCKTSDLSTSSSKTIQVGGWSKRISIITATSHPSNDQSNKIMSQDKKKSEKGTEDSAGQMPRSASFEPPQGSADSFWDDDDDDWEISDIDVTVDAAPK